MAARVVAESAAGRISVPPEIAAGPSVPVWAEAEMLAQLAMITEAHPDWHRRTTDAMISARGAWSRAVSQWAVDADLDNLTARSMVTSRMPFWP